jgi:hypothetical protein
MLVFGERKILLKIILERLTIKKEELNQMSPSKLRHG